MKEVLLFIILFTCCRSMTAQGVISLEQAAALDKDGRSYPSTIQYVKDINNSLDKYVGIWRGVTNGRLFEIRFSKLLEYSRFSKGIKWDKLVGRVLIKDSVSGTILYTTLNTADSNTLFSGNNFSGNQIYNLDFAASSTCYDWGSVSIATHQNDSTQLTLFFTRDSELIDPNTCAGGYENYRTMLPSKLFLQKQ